MKRIPLVLVAFLLLPSIVFAKFDPDFTWTTLETPHFAVHYHQGGEALAKRAASIAEDVHERLAPRIKWKPASRTHLILVDFQDDVNGLSTTFPYNHVILFITQPAGGPGFGTIRYDEWLRTLITHEYTHILHLDMVNGIPEVVQDIFGRIYFPNMFEPVWMIEGLAVYEETEQTSGGRGRSPGSEMIIRQAVLENNFPDMSRATTFPDTWPAGEVPYLFGEGFTRFLVEKYGREKFADVFVAYSGRGLPFLVNSTGRRVLQAEYNDLWNDWLNTLRTRYNRVRDEVSAHGLTLSQPLTRRGYMNTHPAWSPDGSRIAYAVENADEFPGIFVMNADGTADRRLVDNLVSAAASGRSLAWSADGRGIYYTKLDFERSVDLYNDIYYYDVIKREERRMTSGLRGRDPSPSPDGNHLVFVANRLGKTRLARLDLTVARDRPAKEQEIVYLTEESDTLYATPRYSPDGSMIAVAVHQPDGYQDIWVLDNSGKKLRDITHDRAIDEDAAWSPDGKTIYFSSDRTGIFNLYAYDMASNRLAQVTNVLGGAFTPAVSADGRTIAFSSYTSKGYDLQVMQLDALTPKSVAPYQDTAPVTTYDEKPVTMNTGPYSPLSTIYPRFWLPWFGFSRESGDLFGFLTYGQDAVEQHAYLLNALYSPTTTRTWYSFDYAYDGLYPTVQVLAQDIDKVYSGLLIDAAGGTDYTERSRTLDLSLMFPVRRIEQQHFITIGFRRNDVSALTQLPPWTGYRGQIPAEGALASGRVSYRFNNAKEFGFSISPERGRTINLGCEKLDTVFGSDFNSAKYTVDWHEYIALPARHHVLLARGFVGLSRGDQLPQRAFQLGGDDPGNTTLPVDTELVHLRGYRVNEFRGQNAALATLEYRFPIRNIESGWDNAPVFLRRMHGAVFVESGNAWDAAFSSRDFKSAVGAEARLDTYIAYYLPITFRLVLAKGLDEKRELSLYFGLWMPALF